MFNSFLCFVKQFFIFVVLKMKDMELMSQLEFTRGFNDLSPSLKSFAYNLTKDREESKDLYQETAFRAMTNRDKFHAGTNLKAWLFTIMKNIFINNYRKKVKSNTVTDNSDNLFFLNSGEVEISNGATTNIMMDELGEMIEQLEESIRVPFEMHYIGYKYQEIADKLKLPLGTVKSRIFFARKELKDRIKVSYGDFELVRNRLSA